MAEQAKGSGVCDVVSEDDSGVEEENSMRKRAKKFMNESRIVDFEIDFFSATLKGMDDQHRTVERKRLAFEREKYEDGRRRYE